MKDSYIVPQKGKVYIKQFIPFLANMMPATNCGIPQCVNSPILRIRITRRWGNSVQAYDTPKDNKPIHNVLKINVNGNRNRHFAIRTSGKVTENGSNIGNRSTYFTQENDTGNASVGNDRGCFLVSSIGSSGPYSKFSLAGSSSFLGWSIYITWENFKNAVKENTRHLQNTVLFFRFHFFFI